MWLVKFWRVRYGSLLREKCGKRTVVRGPTGWSGERGLRGQWIVVCGGVEDLGVEWEVKGDLGG